MALRYLTVLPWEFKLIKSNRKINIIRVGKYECNTLDGLVLCNASSRDTQAVELTGIKFSNFFGITQTEIYNCGFKSTEELFEYLKFDDPKWFGIATVIKFNKIDNDVH